MIRARSRVQEVELICKLIKRLVAERPDRDLSAICVAMVHPQRYTDILREQFARFGIPANITDRFELQRSPVATAILAMLQVPLNGFRRDDVLRAVQAPYWKLGRQGETVDASNLEAVSRKLHLTAGYRTWLSRIEARRAGLQQRRGGAGPADNLRDIDREVRSLEKADFTPYFLPHRSTYGLRPNLVWPGHHNHHNHASPHATHWDMLLCRCRDGQGYSHRNSL